jgi:hypothetical protein
MGQAQYPRTWPCTTGSLRRMGAAPRCDVRLAGKPRVLRLSRTMLPAPLIAHLRQRVVCPYRSGTGRRQRNDDHQELDCHQSV